MTGLDLTRDVLRNVDRRRKRLGLSVAEVAEAAGVTRQYLYLLRGESGEGRVITLDLLARFACALDVEPVKLLQTRKRSTTRPRS